MAASEGAPRQLCCGDEVGSGHQVEQRKVGDITATAADVPYAAFFHVSHIHFSESE